MTRTVLKSSSSIEKRALLFYSYAAREVAPMYKMATVDGSA